MAVDAEVAELAAGLALAAPVHREEHRVIGGVGVHRARPLREVLRVAVLAGVRILELLDGELLALAPREAGEREAGKRGEGGERAGPRGEREHAPRPHGAPPAEVT